MEIVKGKASIVILTYNNLKDTQQCLDSIFTKTNDPDFEIIVVDNGSQDETPQFLQEYTQSHPNLNLHLNASNEGFARGNNIGAAAATGEYLAFLNNDTVVTRGWLSVLIDHLHDPSVGMIGPVTNSSSNETRIEVDYDTDTLEGLDTFAEKYTAVHKGETFEIPTLAFMCVAMRREVFEEIGPLDERFGLGMFEDDDYAMRLRQKGYKLFCIEDVFIHHWGGSSFHKMAQFAYWQLFRENREKYEEKWGIQWRPHLWRPNMLPGQVESLTEWGYDLQWNLLHQEQLVELLRHQVDDLAQDREYLISKIDTLNDNIADQNFKLVDQNQKIVDQNQKIVDLDQQLSTRTHELNEIYASYAWKTIQRIWSVRVKLLPHNSLGERILFKIMGRSPRPSATAKPDGALRRTSTSAVQVAASGETDITSPGSSQLPIHNEIAILAPQFFDLKGENLYLGGAERYLVELARLIKGLGYAPKIYQGAEGEWEREFEELPILGLDTHGDAKRLNIQFHNALLPDVPVIYLAFDLAFPHCNRRAIGVSHGVYWDQTDGLSIEQRQQQLKKILGPMTNLPWIVSVDTNTINWVRTVRHALSDKFTYIPNFVDLDRFRPASHEDPEKLIVIYPRRLNGPRGFWLVHEIVPEFLEEYPQVEFHFVGQANPPEEKAISELVTKFADRVQWLSLPLDQMHQVYQQADITLIPTLGKEGTSLSCLEAMASGSAVIATNVGGLPDLIIPGYNGLLIEPDVSALRDALHELCRDEVLRSRLAQQAIEVASTFNLERWRARWTSVLREHLLYA